MGKRVLVAGGSGEVGKRLLQHLVARNDVNQVHLINRHPQDFKHSKIIQHQIEFKHLNALDLELEFDFSYCCLGSTIKKAGSKDAFEKIDLHYVQLFAKMAKRHQCLHFAVISSVDAKTSTNNFYLHTKGRMEETLTAMDWSSLWVFRPSLLVGVRQEFRLAEKLAGIAMQLISPIMVGPIKNYRPVAMDSLALVMASAIDKPESGVQIVESKQISEWAQLDFKPGNQDEVVQR